MESKTDSENQQVSDSNVSDISELKTMQPAPTSETELFDSLEQLEKAICDYEESSQSNYIIRQKSKHFGNDDVKPDVKSRILWRSQDTDRGVGLKFTGVPYIFIGRKTLLCHLGKDLGVHKKRQYAEQRNLKQREDHTFLKPRDSLQHCKKLGCPAEIHIAHIIQFPDFKIIAETERRKKSASKRIKEALLHGNLRCVTKYAAKFPLISDHKFHPVSGQMADLQEKVDIRIEKKIISLHHDGVRKISEMMRHLNSFISKELFPGVGPPPELRRRFYPNRKSILNIMHKAKYAGRNSSIDQDNLLNILNQWQQQNPKLNVYCRPTTATDDMPDKNTFLLCYQTEWQKKMLVKYGNQITLLDATYRTTRYALPLFFLCVRTNVGYAVVGAFVTQQETSACILEALQFFKTWNPSWKPNCFLVDFCQEEINAIRDLFQDTNILLCDFHREKAWVEWLNKKDHCALSSRKVILKMLRSIARATNMEEHVMAIRTLEESAIWNTNNALKQWFSKKWMPEIQKWAHVYRTGLSNFGINTNNGLERQHEVLKHNYLDGYKNCTLSEMVTVLHEHFFPNTYRKYVEFNLKCSQYYRKYRDDVPVFLRNRPKDFVKKVMEKMTSSLDESDITIINQDIGSFKVKSENTKGQSYDVLLTGVIPMCTCLYWKNSLLPCKHMCCVFKYVDGWGWDKLNLSYRNNPLFSLDTDILNVQIEPEENVEGEQTQPLIDLSEIKHFEELPPRRVTKRTTLIRSYTQTIKELTDTVYLIKDNSVIEKVICSLKDLLETAKLKIPIECGLPLIETPKKKKIFEKYDPLPKRIYGKPKQPASQRVGEKAEMLRQDVWESLDSENEEIKSGGLEQIKNKDDTWSKINAFRLTYADRDVITNGNWLDDNIINACQQLISKKFPSVAGLYDTLLVQQNCISSIDDCVIQIHHLGDHWVVSHYSKSVLKIYDSMKPFGITEKLKNQITKMYAPLFSGEYATLDVTFKCCQKQIGCNDCGLFSIANAVSLAHGINLNDIQFVQKEMRSHLLRCIEAQDLTMFPHVPKKKTFKIVTKKIKMTTFCICKIHKEKEIMVECTSCKMWYHLDCVGLQSNDKCVVGRKKYFCHDCTKAKK